MLMVVKNQIRVSMLSIRYALMKEMLNKTTFISNIVFMILNNASFIIQWLVLFSLRSNFGGYTLQQVLLLWAIASGSYGFSHFFFKRAYSLSEIITNGKMDSYLVQPKNVLFSAITSDVETSALGDLIYAYIVLIIYGITPLNFILFTALLIISGTIITCVSIIVNSLSFWINKADMLADTANGLMTNFATYPDGIFKGAVKAILYILIPVGFTAYIPVRLLMNFNVITLLILILVMVLFIFLAFTIFYKGLKRYSSTNLMIARI